MNKNKSNNIGLHRNLNLISKTSAVLSIVLSATPGILYADIGITGILEYMNNAARIDNSLAESDIRQELTIDGNYARETENFLLGLDYRATKSDYRDDFQDDRTTLTGNAELVWKISPEVLDWYITNPAI